jgi:hypothetical protein
LSARPDALPPPPGSYWVEPQRLLAGAYPGHVDPRYAAARVGQLIDLGVDWFLDLTCPGELPSYEPLLPGPDEPGRGPVTYSRRPIRDHDLPRIPDQMIEILDELDEALATGHCVYVHCRAGIGRTGTVIGCHLARRLGGGAAALAALEQLWRAAGRDLDYPRTPETDAQCSYVLGWREPARPSAPGTDDITDRLRDRYRGLLLGLALGDALAAPAQHRRPGTFMPLGDLVGGGPFELPRGAWTDDTAIALALAESLLANGGFAGRDFVARLARWQRTGEGSATGQCLGITATTARALAQAQWSGNPFAGSHDPARAERGPPTRSTTRSRRSSSRPRSPARRTRHRSSWTRAASSPRSSSVRCRGRRRRRCWRRATRRCPGSGAADRSSARSRGSWRASGATPARPIPRRSPRATPRPP